MRCAHVCCAHCACAALRMYALFTPCPCTAHALHACSDFANTAHAPRLDRSCTPPAPLVRYGHTACSVSTCSYTCTCTCTCTARVLPARTIRTARALHVRCACSRVHRAPIAHTLRIRSRARHVHCSCTTLTCTAICRTLHVRYPRATLTCALSMPRHFYMHRHCATLYMHFT